MEDFSIYSDAEGQRPEQRRHRARAKRRPALRLFAVCLFIAALLTATFCIQRGGLSRAELWLNSQVSAVQTGGEAEIPPSGEDGEDTAQWALLLVNRQHPIPEGYEVTLKRLANGERVDERIYPALREMFDAAREEGIYPVVAAGYRTAEKQQSLMDEKIAALEAEGCSRKEAEAEAEYWVAVPGTSEHQLGLAVDINADGIHSKGSDVYEWLEENAHRYGFIFRYPPDKTELTGVAGEPWHYRYVGAAAAAKLYAQGLCLEEYLSIEK